MDESKERPAFEVTLPNGYVCSIYASGKVEGFGEYTKIVNRIPQLLADAVLYAKLAEKAEREKAIAKVEAADRYRRHFGNRPASFPITDDEKPSTMKPRSPWAGP